MRRPGSGKQRRGRCDTRPSRADRGRLEQHAHQSIGVRRAGPAAGQLSAPTGAASTCAARANRPPSVLHRYAAARLARRRIVARVAPTLAPRSRRRAGRPAEHASARPPAPHRRPGAPRAAPCGIAERIAPPLQADLAHGRLVRHEQRDAAHLRGERRQRQQCVALRSWAPAAPPGTARARRSRARRSARGLLRCRPSSVTLVRAARACAARAAASHSSPQSTATSAAPTGRPSANSTL